jgi:hypothetical protein
MDRKVSREARSRVPLLVRGETGERAKGDFGEAGEQILWVVGHGVSEASRVSAGSSRLALRWVAS